ncbi:MAG TPA: thrombospondin type 3 repeat-containing protein [Dehalococcoidia bacterium]|nr:thrombospondin type 3 repeat-containing protein [Dehalococcoidia bacterium]
MKIALWRIGSFALLLLALFLVGRLHAGPANSSPGSTVRISIPNLSDQGVLGTEANGPSHLSSISNDGRYVAFESDATNLVLGDTNGVQDVFVHDRLTGATERVSVGSSGGEANGASFHPDISGDGTVVAFSSRGSNLVAGDTLGDEDIFIHDRTTGTTERVSVDSSGGQAIGASYSPSLSADGLIVAFESQAQLVSGDHDQQWDTYVHERTSGNTSRVPPPTSELSGNPSVSADGVDVAFFSYDFSRISSQVYVHDRQAVSTSRASNNSSGNPGNAYSGTADVSISGDGHFVTFSSGATNLVLPDTANLDVFLRDRQASVTERISTKPDGTSTGLESWSASISADGRFVAFQSEPEGSATELGLVPGDTNNAPDAFVRDRLMMVTRRVSVDSAGNQVNLGGGRPEISADGHFVAFLSSSADLVPGDINGVSDIFVNDLQGDSDGDGYIDTVDNCWSVSNPEQANGDSDPAGDSCDNCPTVTNANQWDNDTDALGNECDNCPGTVNPAQENNIHPATYTGDRCEDPDYDAVSDFADNCPDTYNRVQTNTDGDPLGDACDFDDDNDGVSDVAEPPCGGDPLDVTPPLLRPERLDLPGDDDGDTLIDEPLPAGSEAFDCDGDGYTGAAEAHVFSDTNVRDQDPCGTADWPADLVSGGVPDSTNRLTITDLTSFLAPVRHINTSETDAGYDVRWDLVPGAGLFSKVINISDLTSVIVVGPPMLGGARAFNGLSCPWP